MTRNLFASTAIAVLLATGAYAQTTPAPEATPSQVEAPVSSAATVEGHLASKLIGESVYNGTTDEAQNIGKVNDLVIDSDGKVQSIVIGVGGFLGIGEKNVAVDYSTIDWAERDGDRWIVIAATTDELKNLPAFDAEMYQPKPLAANEPIPTAPVATAPVANGEPAATIDKSTLQPLDTASIKAEDFVGTTVYGMGDERVGEINDIVLQGDKVDAIVLGVGGFLGIGEKNVAVGLDNLAFMTDTDGNRYLYTEFTKEQLNAAPAFDKAGYEGNRDQMRIVVPN
ncbi:MAG: PRC-barrel domain-containing protein [Mesorhizobium sp.]